MNINIYDFNNYKDYLRGIVDGGERGAVKRLAEAAGCQRSYLSQALNGHVNLTPDQVFGIGAFLQLSDREQDYLLLLLESDRAATPSYQKRIQNKLNQAKEKNQRLSKRIGKSQSREVSQRYYSAWYYSALHIATSIERLRSESDLANFLSLPKKLTAATLRELEVWGLVSFEGGVWEYVQNSAVHLTDRSTLNRMNHLNWRMKALSQNLDAKKSVHYTSSFTVSQEDVRILRDQLMKFIKSQRRTIEQSGTDTLISFCCDFFEV